MHIASDECALFTMAMAAGWFVCVCALYYSETHQRDSDEWGSSTNTRQKHTHTHTYAHTLTHSPRSEAQPPPPENISMTVRKSAAYWNREPCTA